MTVRRLAESDAEAVRAVRLEGLKAHPENFGADHDREAAQTLDWWKKRIAGGGGFGAWEADELVGVISFWRHGEKKHAHQGVIGGFYVRPGHRGKGIGDALMKAALEEATKSVEHVTLTVTAANAGAIRLYERNGFMTVGRLIASIRVDGVDHDELSLHRRVSASD
ncbi:MAG: GNAT family N-acetyltransferase [Rhizomicrobium sp.]